MNNINLKLFDYYDKNFTWIKEYNIHQTFDGVLNGPEDWVKKHVNLISHGKQVVDLACGRGRHARFLLSAGYSVLALDKDVSGIDDISALPNLEIVEADLEIKGALPLQGRKFSGIVVVNYLYRPLFSSLIDNLASDGVLIYQTFMLGNEMFGKPSNPAFLLKENELNDVFSEKLAVVDFEQGYTGEPKSAFVQKICAVKR